MHLDPKVTFRSVAAAFFDDNVASCIVAVDWSRGPHLGIPFSDSDIMIPHKKVCLMNIIIMQTHFWRVEQHHI